MKSLYKRAPLEILFISSLLGILLASRLYLFKELKTELAEFLFSMLISFFVFIFFCRIEVFLCWTLSFLVFSHLLLSTNTHPQGYVSLKGNIVSSSEHSFILNTSHGKFLVPRFPPDNYNTCVVKCRIEKLNLKNQYERNLFFNGIAGKCIPESLIFIATQENSLRQIRRQIRSSTPSTLEGEIVKAITVGERKGIPSHIKRLFIRTGTSHLLAISGIHFATLVAFTFFFFRKIFSHLLFITKRFNPYTLPFLISLPILVMYMLLNLKSISALRAFIMTFLFTTSFISLEKIDLLNIVGASGFILLSLNPFFLFNPSFQLSFSAVHFIVFYLEGVKKSNVNIPRFIKPLFHLFMITLFAGGGTLPVVIHTFGYISWKSLFSNIIAVPAFTGIIIPLSFLHILFSRLLYLREISWELLEFNIKGVLVVLKIIDSWTPSLLFPPSMPSIYYYAFYSLPFILHTTKASLLKHLLSLALFIAIPVSLTFYPFLPSDSCALLSNSPTLISIPFSHSIVITDVKSQSSGKIKKVITDNHILSLNRIYISGNEKSKIKIIKKLIQIFPVKEVHSIDGNELTTIKNLCKTLPPFK